MENWIAFDIGTYTLQMAVIKDGQPFVKSYSLPTEENIYYTNEPKLSEGQLSFVSRFIKVYKSKNVVFVIPPNVSLSYTSALYDVARRALTGKIRFIESHHAAVLLYSHLTGVECYGKNAVIDFGYSKTSLYFSSSEQGESDAITIFDTTGVSRLDDLLLSYLNEKKRPNSFSKQIVGKAREELSYGYCSFLSQDDNQLCEFNREEFNEIFDQGLSCLKAIIEQKSINRLFLTGGGARIPRFTECILQWLSDAGMTQTQVIRGLKTNKGSFHCQNASLVGALVYVTYKNEKKTIRGTLLQKQCSNPHCRKLQSEEYRDCHYCNVEIEAEYFYRCSSCGTVVPKDFCDNENNFCCNCGKHKIELIKNI